MQLQHGVGTHVGMKRGNNEDGFLAQPAVGLFCVADGMGGHAGGERASQLALETLGGFFRLTEGVDPDDWALPLDGARSVNENRLLLGVHAANASVFRANREDPENPTDMGTTVAALSLVDGQALTAHVGDSRVYRHRDGELTALTQDHTLLNEYLRRGKLTPQEAETFPQKNVLVRSVGQKAQIEVDLGVHAALPGDVYLLCSDGLWGLISAELIAGVLGRADDLERGAQQLIDLANSFGGNDNITAVLVRVVSAG
jgi:serine/threonine protein phosphatase PrpC